MYKRLHKSPNYIMYFDIFICELLNCKLRYFKTYTIIFYHNFTNGYIESVLGFKARLEMVGCLVLQNIWFSASLIHAKVHFLGNGLSWHFWGVFYTWMGMSLYHVLNIEIPMDFSYHGLSKFPKELYIIEGWLWLRKI